MRELLGRATVAAQRAASAIMPLYGHTTTTLKADESPVTQADMIANEILFELLGETGITILSEETLNVEHPYPEFLWIIDPLDGTVGFINGTDDFSVMIGLLHNGRPALSVIAAPALEKLYVAIKGEGAFLTDRSGTRQLRVSDRTVPDLIAIESRNHAKPYMQEVARAVQARDTFRVGSVGIKAGAIAEGRGDFYLSMGTFGEWDICAPELLLKEAGGMMTDRHGNPLSYENTDYRISHGIVASNTVCHPDILKALTHVDTSV